MTVFGRLVKRILSSLHRGVGAGGLRTPTPFNDLRRVPISVLIPVSARAPRSISLRSFK